MSVFGWQQVAHGVLVFLFVFAVRATLAEPALQVFARRGSELGEEKSGAALIAGPHHVGMSLQGEISARQHAAKRQIRDYGHGFGGLYCEAVLADIDADSGKASAFEIQIDESFYFIARRLAPICIPGFSLGL